MNAPPPIALHAGSLFHGRYVMVRCIQAGGMGAVYEVIDRKTRRHRALKVMLPTLVSDPDFRARFQREATVTAEIESDHIVETFDADVDRETGAPFLVMELLKGDDLGRILVDRGPFSALETVVLLKQAAMALDRTHAAGVVHRDLKPENLFLTRTDDGAPKIKVLDFGIAKVVESSVEGNITRTLGTPLYMAPEQIRGDAGIDRRADLFALGHIAYAMLAGEAYWAEDSEQTQAMYALFSRMLLGPKERPSERAPRRRGVTLPRTLDRWFLHATALDPAMRFESATGLVAALKGALGVVADTGAPLVDIAIARGSSFPSSGGGAQDPDAASTTPLGGRTERLAEAPISFDSGAGSAAPFAVNTQTHTPVARDRRVSNPPSDRRRIRNVALAALAVPILIGVTALVLHGRSHGDVAPAAGSSASPQTVVIATAASEAPTPSTIASSQPVVSTTDTAAPSAIPSSTTAAAASEQGRPTRATTKASSAPSKPQASPGSRAKPYDPTDSR